ncbi:hypothetical protein HDV05_003421 [Chytridiales sp. JEL 0842]|nr:hypothetical protein HDV05_003421 [Chytridiales sp. JEL 0842]
MDDVLDLILDCTAAFLNLVKDQENFQKLNGTPHLDPNVRAMLDESLKECEAKRLDFGALHQKTANKLEELVNKKVQEAGENLSDTVKSQLEGYMGHKLTEMNNKIITLSKTLEEKEATILSLRESLQTVEKTMKAEISKEAQTIRNSMMSVVAMTKTRISEQDVKRKDIQRDMETESKRIKTTMDEQFTKINSTHEKLETKFSEVETNITHLQEGQTFIRNLTAPSTSKKSKTQLKTTEIPHILKAAWLHFCNERLETCVARLGEKIWEEQSERWKEASVGVLMDWAESFKSSEMKEFEEFLEGYVPEWKEYKKGRGDVVEGDGRMVEGGGSQ